MKIKNVTETVPALASTLVTSKHLSPEVQAKLQKVSLIADKDERRKAQEAIGEEHADISIKLKEDLDKLGVKSFTDFVDLKLTLGGFFFDLIFTVWEREKKPQAPLKMAVYQKQVQDLAERLQDEDEIEVSESDLSQVRAVLDNDAKWMQSRISAEIIMKDALQPSMMLSPQGVSLFQKVLLAGVAVFEKEKDKFEQAKEDKKTKKKAVKKKAKKKR